MAWYRAYFLNDRRRIADVEEFRSGSDEEARTHGDNLLKNRRGFIAIELWQEARPVFLYPQNQLAVA